MLFFSDHDTLIHHTHSARIGKLEDDEDIRREQAESSRKRKRKPSPIRKYGAPKSKLKQLKLPF